MEDPREYSLDGEEEREADNSGVGDDEDMRGDGDGGWRTRCVGYSKAGEASLTNTLTRLRHLCEDQIKIARSAAPDVVIA